MQKIPPVVPQSNANNILVSVVISFALGILWGRSTIWQEAVLLLALATLTACILLGHLYLKQIISYFLLLPFFFILGIIHVGPYLKPPEAPIHIYNQITSKQSVTVTGVLTESPSITTSSNGPKTRLLMAVYELQRPSGGSQKTESVSIPSTGIVLLTLKGFPPPNLVPGDHFMARANLSRVRSFSIPGTFNYKEFLANQAIWITGWVKSPVNIIKLMDLSSPTLQTASSNYLYLAEQFRYRISLFLNETLGDRVRGLYKTILIGDRSEVPPDVLENFKESGCFHILTISGMHMGLLGIFFIAGLNWLLRRSTWILLHIPVLKTATLLSLPFLIFYALIAGFNTPVIRSLLMTTIIILATILDCRKSLLTNIAIAALIILIWQPTSLFTVSFQLSFSAVTAIAVIYPKIFQLLFVDTIQKPDRGTPSKPISTEIKKQSELFRQVNQKKILITKGHTVLVRLKIHPEKIQKWLVAAIMISITALLGTAPLLLYYFNRISLASPFTNLIVEPLICLWALPIGLMASSSIPFFPDFAANLFVIGSWGLKASEWFTSVFSGLPFASICFPSPTIFEIMSYYVLFLCLFFPFPQRVKKIYLKQIVIWASLFFLTASPIYSKVKRKLTPESIATFLDVGQGSCSLLELPYDQNILIDGGGPSSERFNIGERLIAPYLWKRRISHLAGVVITHPHADHFNGLFFIIKHFKPKYLWINGEQARDSSYTKLLELARHHNVKVTICKSETILFKSGPAFVKCISNPCLEDIGTSITMLSEKSFKKSDLNSTSMVLKFRHSGGKNTEYVSILFPGDINEGEEKKLIASQKQLDAHVLLSPHHGSKSANSCEFLEAVSPKYLVISTGPFNNAPDINPLVEELCNKTGIKIYTTPRDGTISFTTNGVNLSANMF